MKLPRLHGCVSCARPVERAGGGKLPGARLYSALRVEVRSSALELVPEKCIGPCDNRCALVFDGGPRCVVLVQDLEPELDLAILLRSLGSAEAILAAFPGRSRRMSDW